MAPENKEPQLQVGENLSIRYGDVTISITADPDGILAEKTSEQIIKYCADLLLRTTDENTLENFLDTMLSIQETLVDDFGWKELDARMFMAAWRKKLYLKQIGEENPPTEDFSKFRAIQESEAVAEGEDAPPRAENAEPILEAGVVTIGIPVSKKNILTPEQVAGTEELTPEDPAVSVKRVPVIPPIKTASEEDKTNEFTVVEEENKDD